ncbi:aldo/keto reductase [Pirellulaceae bacterium SH467]
MSRTPPSVGYGFWKVENDRAAALTVQAIEMGYRHLDCASDYGNEAEVGQGIEKALSQRLCAREALWVTSKLWNTNHRAEHVLPALKRSLSDLRVDYLDLYLIHFPIALKHVPESTRYPAGWFFDPEAKPPRMEYDPVPILETWQAMEELVDQGLVKQIGVSNFSVALIRDLLTRCRIRPSVLQVESHPYLVQSKLLRYCQQESIAMTAFSPLGAPSYIPLGMATQGDSVLDQPVILEIASRHSKSPAQVVLRWGVQRGTSVIPKSSNPDRLRENLDVEGFALSEEEMGRIGALDRGQRFNDPGVFCEQAFNTFFPIYE